eukprot:7331410-Heterocapsa_arctica.AAC.1
MATSRLGAGSRLARLAGQREQLGSAVFLFVWLGGAPRLRSTLSQCGPSTRAGWYQVCSVLPGWQPHPPRTGPHLWRALG